MPVLKYFDPTDDTWKVLNNGGGSGVYTDAEPPADPEDGMLWFDTDETQLADASFIPSLHFSQPVDGATRASATLGSLNTPWTDDVTVAGAQRVKYTLQVSIQMGGNEIQAIALVRGGTIIDRRLAPYEGGVYETTAILTGIDNPGVGTHTYEVIVAASSGSTATVNVSVDTSTAFSLSSDGVSSMQLELVTVI